MDKQRWSKKGAKQRGQQPDSAAGSSRELSDEELGSVSGGRRHKRGGSGQKYIELVSWQMGSSLAPGSSSESDSAGKVDIGEIDVH